MSRANAVVVAVAVLTGVSVSVTQEPLSGIGALLVILMIGGFVASRATQLEC